MIFAARKLQGIGLIALLTACALAVFYLVSLRVAATQSELRQDALADYERLAEEAQGSIDGLTVSWTAQGQLRATPGGADEVWLHLSVQARLPLPDSGRI